MWAGGGHAPGGDNADPSSRANAAPAVCTIAIMLKVTSIGKPCAPGGDNTGRHTEPPRVTHPSPRFRLEAALRGCGGNILRNVDDE